MLIPQQAINNVLDQVLPHIERHVGSQTSSPTKRPFVLALTGLQGSGKSTWTDVLVKALREIHNYKTINLSLDDLYLDHDDLVKLRTSNPTNELVQTRGQPGTHDMALARSFFESLNSGNEVLIPFFDKSKFNGEGGRASAESWDRIAPSTKIDIVVFEGWCVGFQPLEDMDLRQRWEEALHKQCTSVYPTETLGCHAVKYLLEANWKLRGYCDLFMGPQHLDFLVHLDTDDLVNVYQWRIQQEHALRQRASESMSDEEVVRFVKRYMPAYELYLDQLRRGIFDSTLSDAGKGQLRVVLDQDRNIVDTVMHK
jgi:D-glycerate 3-kinase